LPARRKGDEAVGQERLVGAVAEIKTEVRVAAALVRMVAIELPTFATREIADTEDRVRKTACDASGGSIDEADERG
jgi:hypothetical protein